MYDWGLPDDPEPVLGLIGKMERGEVDALAFTQPDPRGAQSARNCRIRRPGRFVTSQFWRGSVAVASVGPRVHTRKLLESGIDVDVEPDHPPYG